MISAVYLFILSLAGFAALLAFWSVPVGLSYFASVLPLAIFSWIVRNRPPFVFTPIFGAALSFFAFYFIRPLFLVPNREFYPYDLIGVPTDALLIEALFLQGLFAFTFLFGLYFALHVRGSQLRVPESILRRGVVDRLGPAFLLFLLVLLLVWFALFLFTGAGQKLVTTWTNLLLLVLPVSLILPAAIAYLGRTSRDRLSLFQSAVVVFIVASNVAISLFSGSKSGIFLLILYVVFYLLLIGGNIRVRVLRALILGAAAVSTILFSVTLANVAKYSSVSGVSVSSLFSQTIEQDGIFLFLIDKITFRLNGFDGSIAALANHPKGFEAFANWPNIIKSGIAQLLPGISVDRFSLGKAVSVYFGGRSEDVANAGALGLVGVIYFMHGTLVGSFVAGLLGVFFGMLFRIMGRIGKAGRSERLIAFLVMCHMQAFWISSGNLDKLIQELGIAITHMILYFYVMALFVGSGGRRGLTRRSAA